MSDGIFLKRKHINNALKTEQPIDHKLNEISNSHETIIAQDKFRQVHINANIATPVLSSLVTIEVVLKIHNLTSVAMSTNFWVCLTDFMCVFRNYLHTCCFLNISTDLLVYYF